LALIGRKLTNEHCWVGAVNAPFTGSGTGTANGVQGDWIAAVTHGREVMIRAADKY
jgi:iron complex outermembrane receptor protein